MQFRSGPNLCLIYLVPLLGILPCCARAPVRPSLLASRWVLRFDMQQQECLRLLELSMSPGTRLQPPPKPTKLSHNPHRHKDRKKLGSTILQRDPLHHHYQRMPASARLSAPPWPSPRPCRCGAAKCQNPILELSDNSRNIGFCAAVFSFTV